MSETTSAGRDAAPIEINSELLAHAHVSKAWPFEEARKVVSRLKRIPQPTGSIIFETGYGPSGLPHIGTFGEVARTTMVRHAFRILTEDKIPTRLICFSDDMDGLRKVPDNIPNKEMVAAHLEKPLTQVPDPFNQYPSFGQHNNARLRTFLDTFGFSYEFLSATQCYTSGRFDATLLRVLEHYEEIRDVILPTLGPERRATYSPFLPISPATGKVLQVPIIDRDLAAGSILYKDPDTGKLTQVSVTGGHCKLQWKADWAMRWAALGVDYEMAGKDLIDSVRLSGRICRILGRQQPEGFNYELFLDENGEKISKSRGNGLTIEEWLSYASPESLALYMYQSPKKAKRLYFDVIPRAVDEYAGHLAAFPKEDQAAKLTNPVWHIHEGSPPEADLPISFALLLNLASASNSEDRSVLWGFIQRYAPEATPETEPLLDELVGYAIRYFHDFVKPSKQYRAPTDQERAAFADLDQRLVALPDDVMAEEIQNEVYAVGKEHGFEPLRDWFQALYQVLLGQSQGPRFGSFVQLYGIDNTRSLIARALAGELLGANVSNN
ncbi:lysine--tRNA ligase [Methyloceanibacter caenitepidi]|uniref:Lysine--tRNA ligase n=1 Tax=Methyloceanibacter caenitepidi TaxID=1384459 RepID=A0A0A8K2W5_9HYPH|nr:lysine--tRNA ligase [Methyloceanibacter caenitepidi]BAQ16324.1 Lysyl-tRNA synthetase [Methyloceanibacter caenitepidi]